MADSHATRQARYRRHRAGDHSLCRPGPGRCPAVTGDPPRPLVVSPPVGDLDPRVELEALARRLIAASEADPLNTALARALTDVLRALPVRRGALDPLEEIQARVATQLAARRPGVASNVSPIRRGDHDPAG
jgi:hypothetical protein